MFSSYFWRSRIPIFDQWIWIREAQKHMDPTDPDPQHWFDVLSGLEAEEYL